MVGLRVGRSLRRLRLLLGLALVTGCSSLVGEVVELPPPASDAGADATAPTGDASQTDGASPADAADGDAAHTLDAGDAGDAGPHDDAGHTPDAGDAGEPSDAGADGHVEPPPPLVGDWNFTEGSGTTVTDVSGRGHHGVVMGTTSAWVTGHDGIAGSALAFLNDEDYVSIEGSTDFDRPADAKFSMTCWMRTNEVDHEMFFSVSFGDDKQSFGIEVLRDEVMTYYDGTKHVAESPIPSVIDGAWHHYAVVVDDGLAKLYFDGALVGQGSADTTPRTATGVLFGRSTFPDRLRGAVDKARFYRIALTAAEVLAEKNR